MVGFHIFRLYFRMNLLDICSMSLVDSTCNWSSSYYLVVDIEANILSSVEKFDLKVKEGRLSCDVVWLWEVSVTLLQNMELYVVT